MKLERLNLVEFFRDEFGMANGGEGIGASGVITPLQMINVINIDSDDEWLEDKWGLGSHYDTYKEIFKLIYNLDNDNIWNNSSEEEKSKFIDELMNRVITVRYVNQYDRCSEKYILVKIPAYVTKSQFDNLNILNDLLEKCMKKYRISVKVLLKGSIYSGEEKEVFSQVYFDLKVNNLPDVLEYLKVNDRINDGSMIYSDLLLEKEVMIDNLLDKSKRK